MTPEYLCAQGLASHDLLARSGVTEARKRLGADPVEWLFRQTGNQWGCERYEGDSDVPDVAQWIEGGNEPRTLRDSSFAPNRLLSLQSRQAAAYKGLTALLMKHGSRDFITGTPIDLNTYFNNAIDIHHIFPRAWCEASAQRLPREKWNSVVNKAPLAASTNRYIGGDAPSVYLGRVEKHKQVDAKTLDTFLHSHAIPVTELRADNFDDFICKRGSELLKLIEAATGKGISGRDSEETVKAFGAALV